ncbi:MAG: hypothetical protein IT307_13260 [Chloroflexi bacterium]|nr:hypothetical protein [Chloroflexota bacterium]
MPWDLIGHAEIIGRLEHAVQNGSLRHALLLSGRQSLGKRSLALRLAARLSCTSPNPPCGTCRCCHLMLKDAFSDLQVVQLREGRQRISRDDVAALRNEMSRRPTEAPFRVGIIADADRLGPEAENLLLRTLEEPPPRSMFILTVEDASALLPTTVSRCQCIRLRPVPRGEIAAALMERRGVGADRAAMLAALSEGRPGWAIEAASNPSHLAAREAAIERAERAAFGSRLERLSIARALAEGWTVKSAEVRAELRLWSGWWRDAILAGRGLDRHLANADRLPALERAAQRLGPNGLRSGARAIAQLQTDLEQNANPRLAFDVALLALP